MTIYQQIDENGTPYFESRYGKRYMVGHDTPAIRLCAQLQAEASLSMPLGTRATLSEDGTLTLTSRMGDVEVIPKPDAWTFRRAVKNLHSAIDAR